MKEKTTVQSLTKDSANTFFLPLLLPVFLPSLIAFLFKNANKTFEREWSEKCRKLPKVTQILKTLRHGGLRHHLILLFLALYPHD